MKGDARKGAEASPVLLRQRARVWTRRARLDCLQASLAKPGKTLPGVLKAKSSVSAEFEETTMRVGAVGVLEVVGVAVVARRCSAAASWKIPAKARTLRRKGRTG